MHTHDNPDNYPLQPADDRSDDDAALLREFGHLADRYEIYAHCARATGQRVKSFHEWLES